MTNRKRFQKTTTEPVDQGVLDSIGSPNPWTPKTEDAWLLELGKLSVGEIYQRFPPLKKPGNVSFRGRNNAG